MDLSSVDPYSYANPGIAKVVHTHLDLFVDFDKTVLRGKAIIHIEMEPKYDEIILDIYQLNEDKNKMRVLDYLTGDSLEYTITENIDSVGSKFTIQLPRKYKCDKIKFVEYCNIRLQFYYNYKIQIEYETLKDSPALYWLRSDQTSDGIHPFLITNNKFTYTRGIFPCQDSPSVRFTYSAEISVPNNFDSVIICGRKCKEIKIVGDRYKHIFCETGRVPSYAMVIMVGSLEKKKILQSNVTVWAEKKYIEKSITAMANIDKILLNTKILCGPLQVDNEDEYNICVLPSNIPEIEIQYLSIIYVSPMLLKEDPFIICSTIAQKVAQSWTGGLVTCENFQHLWLNKSFSTFISRKIIRRIYNHPSFCYKISFLERKPIYDLQIKINLHGINSQLKLVPNLRGILPKDITKFVPDEIGYFLLKCLQYYLGEPEMFETYLKYYVQDFRFKSINTDDWVNYLYGFFPHKRKDIKSILDMWFRELNLTHVHTICPYLNNPMENHCYVLMKRITTETLNNFCRLLTQLKSYNDIERLEFLTNLYASPAVLPIAKLKWLHLVLPLEEQICENRLLLLRLYIKSKWLEMVQPALKFAREYCTPTFACPIFRELYELEETRHLAISGFTAIAEKKCKMLPQTMEEVASILKINLKDILK